MKPHINEKQCQSASNSLASRIILITVTTMPLAVLLCGCATPPPTPPTPFIFQAYSGPQKPMDQVAVVTGYRNNIYFQKVDDVELKPPCSPVEVEPGFHDFLVLYHTSSTKQREGWNAGYEVNTTSSKPTRVTAHVEAGKLYRVKNSWILDKQWEADLMTRLSQASAKLASKDKLTKQAGRSELDALEKSRGGFLPVITQAEEGSYEFDPVTRNVIYINKKSPPNGNKP